MGIINTEYVGTLYKKDLESYYRGFRKYYARNDRQKLVCVVSRNMITLSISGITYKRYEKKKMEQIRQEVSEGKGYHPMCTKKYTRRIWKYDETKLTPNTKLEVYEIV